MKWIWSLLSLGVIRVQPECLLFTKNRQNPPSKLNERLTAHYFHTIWKKKNMNCVPQPLTLCSWSCFTVFFCSVKRTTAAAYRIYIVILQWFGADWVTLQQKFTGVFLCVCLLLPSQPQTPIMIARSIFSRQAIGVFSLLHFSPLKS